MHHNDTTVIVHIFPLIANSTVLLGGGYKALTEEEILEILKTAYAMI